MFSIFTLLSVLAFFSPEHQSQIIKTAFIVLLAGVDNEAAQSWVRDLCQVLSALLALDGFTEEFCRLQDGISSGR